MQGCGLLAGSLPSDPRVTQLAMNGVWCAAEEPLHPLWESYAPVHGLLMRGPDEKRTNEEIAAEDKANRIGGAGLGIAFGRAWADATGRQVGLIPCAHGGTSLEQWNWNKKSEGGSSLYGAMLDRVARAQAENPGARLAGLLWYQGESDATPECAETYAARFDEWIGKVREDLGHATLPVAVVQIGNVTRAPGTPLEEGWQNEPWLKVRFALGELPDRVAHTAATTAVDLGLTDQIHIDTPDLIRLGQRLAKGALALVAGGSQVGPRLQHIVKKDVPGLGGARLIFEGVTGTWPARMNGFAVRTADGAVHPDIYVIAARPDFQDPRNIDLLLNLPADDSVRIGYALTLEGFFNAADSADMPLLSFAPRVVE